MSNSKRFSFDGAANTLDPLDEDPVYEANPSQILRVVNPGIEPPKRMRRGSYVEDDSYQMPLSPGNEGAAGGSVSRSRDSGDKLSIPDTRRTSSRGSGRAGARRSLIQGPQPQPLQPGMLYPAAPNTSSIQAAPKPRFPSSQDYYRQQHSLSAPRNTRSSKEQITSPGGFGRYSPPLEADEDYAAAEEDEQRRMNSIVIGFSPVADDSSTPSTGLAMSNDTTPSSGPDPSSDGSTPYSADSNNSISNFPFPPTITTQPAPQPPNRRGSASSTGSTVVPGRRGQSSYYSQNSYLVSPIPEESSEYRHGSFASSHAIPSSWGSGIPGLWIPSTNEELMSDGASSISKNSGRSGRSGQGDFADYDEGTTLVRQASMGRKQKPKLTDVVKHSDSKSKSSKSDSSSAGPSAKRGSIASLKLENITRNSMSHEKLRKAPRESIPSPMEMTDDLQPPEKLSLWQRISRLSMRSNSSDVIPKPLRIANSSPDLRGKENASPQNYGPRLGVPSGTLNRQRPPRLDIDAVRDAEARGSLTSLPDLIRRATKLAAVLETGTRPDSRWGMNGSRAPSVMSTESTGMNNGRYQESLSDILASFPPPMPSSRRLSTPGATWPHPSDLQYLHSGTPSQIQRKRKICGLPLWAFIVLVLLAMVIITASVIVPLQLVALSKDKNKSNGSSGLTADSCAASNPCQNGGMATVQNGTCSCICTGDFVGDHCETSQDPACTSITVQDANGKSKNITVGITLPRLIAKASSYSIPLSAESLASVFNAGNVTCMIQNALVTMDGATAPPGVDPTSTSTSSNSETSTTTATDSGLDTAPMDQNVIDFARVAVLFIAENVGMTDAINARDGLDGAFQDGTDYGVIAFKDGVTVDLSHLSINVGNGTEVGGPTTGGSSDGGYSKLKMLARRRKGDTFGGKIWRRHGHHSLPRS